MQIYQRSERSLISAVCQGVVLGIVFGTASVVLQSHFENFAIGLFLSILMLLSLLLVAMPIWRATHRLVGSHWFLAAVLGFTVPAFILSFLSAQGYPHLLFPMSQSLPLIGVPGSLTALSAWRVAYKPTHNSLA